jgi:hypothetical protein
MVQNMPNRQYMNTDQFCFWLQGLFELCPDLTSLTDAQVKMIKEHLGYVFQGKETYSVVPQITTSTLPGYVSLQQSTSSTYPEIIQTVC